MGEMPSEASTSGGGVPERGLIRIGDTVASSVVGWGIERSSSAVPADVEATAAEEPPAIATGASGRDSRLDCWQ